MRDIFHHQAANVMMFMVSSSDHVTGAGGKTLTVTLSKNGAAFAGISPTVTDRSNGWYNIALVAANTDTLGDLAVRATAPGTDDGNRILTVIANAVHQSGSVTTGSSTTSFIDTGIAGGADDIYNDSYVTFVTGNTSNLGAVRKITDFVNSSKTFTVDAFPATPGTGDKFIIING